MCPIKIHNNKKIIFLFIILIFSLIFTTGIINASEKTKFLVGISPDILKLNNNTAELIIYNYNNQSINYTIINHSNILIDQFSGTIQNNSIKRIKIRLTKNNNTINTSLRLNIHNTIYIIPITKPKTENIQFPIYTIYIISGIALVGSISFFVMPK